MICSQRFFGVQDSIPSHSKSYLYLIYGFFSETLDSILGFVREIVLDSVYFEFELQTEQNLTAQDQEITTLLC